MVIEHKVDLVVERQWHIGMHARALDAMNTLGIVYGGFPACRYESQGIERQHLKVFPLPALINHALTWGAPMLPWSLNEPEQLAKRIARRKGLARVVACYATAYRWLFPVLKKRGHVLLLERGSCHPEYYFNQIEQAREDAGLPCCVSIPTDVCEEIEAGKLAHFIGVGSQMIADSYIQRGYDPERILLAPWCTDPERFSCKVRSSGSEIRLLCVGIVGLRKGVWRLIQIAKWAKKRRLSVQIRLVGPLEPEAAELLAAAPDNIEAVGVRKGQELVVEFHAADIYILPSYEEGFGISILEGMSTGLPAVVSQETGGREAIRSGENGMILNGFAEQDLDAYLAPLIQRQDLRLSMGKCARDTVLQHYTEAHYRRAIAHEYGRMFDIIEREGPTLQPAWRGDSYD